MASKALLSGIKEETVEDEKRIGRTRNEEEEDEEEAVRRKRKMKLSEIIK